MLTPFCLSIVTIFFLLTYVRMIYVGLLSLSHRRVTDELQTTIDESQTSHRQLLRTTDESQTSNRRLQTSYRWLQTSHRRAIDESQTSYRLLHTNHSQSSFEYIYKALFSERIWLSNAPMRRWFLLKDGKSRTWCLLKCWKLFLTINQTMLNF